MNKETYEEWGEGWRKLLLSKERSFLDDVFLEQVFLKQAWEAEDQMKKRANAKDNICTS